MSTVLERIAAEAVMGPRLSEEEPLILDPKDPYPGAAEYLRRNHQEGEFRTLLAQGGELFAYTGTHYRRLEESAIRAKLWEFSAGARRVKLRKVQDGYVEDLVPYQPTTTAVNNLLDATRAQAHVDAEHAPPCWLDPRPGDPDPREVVALDNGLLHLPSRELFRPTPRFFGLNALEFAYRPGTPEPEEWLAFLRQLWPDDAESIEVLQEIFGYLLLPDTRQQKAFLLVGPKRSGKGTIGRVLTALLGHANVCAPTLGSLAGPFGLQPLIGKMLALVSDARLSGRADQATIAERLLTVSGEDTVTVERKHLSAWTGCLPTRFMVLTNELPRLADSSGALASRFVVLTLERSFYGREDPLLTERLFQELPGILMWAMDGWDRLTERGHFIQPAASLEAIQELDDLGSPISAFLRARCQVESGLSIDCRALYEAWKSWCQLEGRDHAGTQQTFGRDLRAAIPGLRVAQPRINGVQMRHYEGIGLR